MTKLEPTEEQLMEARRAIADGLDDCGHSDDEICEHYAKAAWPIIARQVLEAAAKMCEAVYCVDCVHGDEPRGRCTLDVAADRIRAMKP